MQDGICTFVVRTGGQQVEQRVAVGTEQTFNEYLLRCLPPSWFFCIPTTARKTGSTASTQMGGFARRSGVGTLRLAGTTFTRKTVRLMT